MPPLVDASPRSPAPVEGGALPRWLSGELRRVAARASAGFALGVGVLVLTLCTLQILAGRGDPALLPSRALLGALMLLVGGPGWWLHRHGFDRWSIALTSVGTALAVFAHAWLTGLGLHATAVVGYSVVIVLAAATLGRAIGAAVGGLFVALAALLAAAEASGRLPTEQVLDSLDPLYPLSGLAAISVAALGAGCLIHRVLARAVHAAGTEERRLSQLLRIGADWTWTIDRRGRLVSVSPSFEKHTGVPVADLLRLGQPGAPLIVDDERWRALQSALRERRTFRDAAMTYRLPDGRELHVVSDGEPRHDAHGRFLGWWGMSRNVTGQVLAERATRRERDIVQRLFEMSPDPICLVELERGRVLLANPAFFSATGKSEAEVIGRNGGQIGLWHRPDDGVRMRDALRAAGGRLHDWHAQGWMKGQLRRVVISAAAFERDGQPVAMMVIRDVTEAERQRAQADAIRRRDERELAAARHQAEAANAAKSAFLATMSHEIRTPLNGVLGLARLLQDELDERRRREWLSHLVGAAEGLAGLVSDVLDLTKIEAGRVVLESIEFDLHEQLLGAFHTFAPLGRERGLAMRCDLSPDLPRRVRGDPVRVRQIVSNYLNNALKFTSAGSIALSATQQGDGSVRVVVSDTGIGIDPSTSERLFQPFSQADTSTTRRFGGTGLGLSICRELALLMGGGVGADGLPGQGSSFWVELPLPAAAPQRAAVVAPAADGQPLAGLTVLVAEDNAVNMLIVRTMLERHGVRVLEAGDGAQAVAVARAAASTLDAVLLDLHMPVQDGLQAARTLRALDDTRALPLIALSAAVLDQDRAQARAAGLDQFLHKPVTEGDLLRVLAPLVRDRVDA